MTTDVPRSAGSSPRVRRSDRHGGRPRQGRRSFLARVDRAAVQATEWFESVRGAVPWAGVAVTAGLIAIVVARGRLRSLVAAVEPVSDWLAVVASVCFQGIPFLVGGVLLSAALSVWVLPGLPRRLVGGAPSGPTRGHRGGVGRHGPRGLGRFEVPVFAVAGVVLPQTSARAAATAAEWVRAGVAPGAAHAYRLCASSANPVALLSTAVFFPGRPGILLARVAIGLVLAVSVGWAWPWLSGDADRARLPDAPTDLEDPAEVGRFIDRARDDLLRAGGQLALAAALAGAFSQLAPSPWLDAVAASAVAVVLLAAVLAVLGGADAMANAVVAVSLTRFPLSAQVAYLVAGPASDLSTAVRLRGWLGARGAARVSVAAAVLGLVGAVVAGRLL